MDAIEKCELKAQGSANDGSGIQQTGQSTNEIFLGKDGFKLFPQPVQGDALDPLNWSFVQKHTILVIIMAL